MGLWDSIGHAVLRYGPYAAAPFTGGASLALLPATSAADAVWGAAQGTTSGAGKPIKTMNQYGPSGMVNQGRALSPTELSGMFPSNGGPASIISPSTDPNSKMTGGIGPSNPNSVNQNSQLFNPTYGMMPQDSSNPNLSFALNQGKTNALMNQPWRQSRGIYPNIPPNQRQFQPQPMPQINQPTTFQQPGQGSAWEEFLKQNPNLMQQMQGGQ